MKCPFRKWNATFGPFCGEVPSFEEFHGICVSASTPSPSATPPPRAVAKFLLATFSAVPIFVPSMTMGLFTRPSASLGKFGARARCQSYTPHCVLISSWPTPPISQLFECMKGVKRVRSISIFWKHCEILKFSVKYPKTRFCKSIFEFFQSIQFKFFGGFFIHPLFEQVIEPVGGGRGLKHNSQWVCGGNGLLCIVVPLKKGASVKEGRKIGPRNI